MRALLQITRLTALFCDFHAFTLRHRNLFPFSVAGVGDNKEVDGFGGHFPFLFSAWRQEGWL